MEIFEELLGDEGTVVVPTCSPTFLRYFQKHDFVFTPDSDSDSGGLAHDYIRHVQGAVRGRQPAKSCASCSCHAELIAAADGLEFPKYSPYAKIVELEVKT